MSEKAAWPHSWATTHIPVHTVPATAAYATQSGRNAAFSGISAPAARHASDCATEIAAYPSDFLVSRVKQCFGTAAFTCAFEGTSAASTRIALPCSPLNPGSSSTAAAGAAAVSGAIAAMSGADARTGVSAGRASGARPGARPRAAGKSATTTSFAMMQNVDAWMRSTRGRREVAGRGGGLVLGVDAVASDP